jgi:hypothetical protein
MVATQPDVSRARYESRPGRRAVVAASLADLRGPAEGTVELPIWLFWSSPDHTFDLGDQDMRRWLYQIVLREAGSSEDLTAYLDGDTLIALWPDLYLPDGVRQAWEEQHPVLRAAATASVLCRSASSMARWPASRCAPPLHMGSPWAAATP